MHRTLAQAGKEFAQFRRDRLTVTLSVVMPLVMNLLFGLALSLDPDGLRLMVIDRDQTPMSRRYVDAFVASGKFDLLWPDSRTDPEHVLSSGTAEAVLIVPPYFERELLAGRVPETQALIDGTDANTALVVRQQAQAVHYSFLRSLLPAAARASPIEADVRFFYNPGLSDRRYFGTGALGMVLIFFPALLGAAASSREIELGTVIQPFASTLSSFEWTMGKAAPYILIGIGELVLCLCMGAFVFDYRLPPDPTAFFAASVFYIAVGVLFGMLVGYQTGTQAAAIQFVLIVVFLLSLLLSGFLTPIENIPTALRWVSALIPARYYVWTVRDGLLRGGGWQAAWPQVASLAALALALFAANVVRMRRMQFRD